MGGNLPDPWVLRYIRDRVYVLSMPFRRFLTRKYLYLKFYEFLVRPPGLEPGRELSQGVLSPHRLPITTWAQYNYGMDDKVQKLLNTGKSKEEGISSKDVNPKQLARGMQVEKEHADDPVIDRKISLDHLTEIPDYYTRLDKMEEQAKTAGYYSILRLYGII